MDVNRSHYHHPVPWDTSFEPLTLPDMFGRSTEWRGDATLLYFLGRRYSYTELYTDAQRFASHLIESGIGKGDRVGLFLPNIPIYVSAYYGAMMAGAVVVNFSPLYTVDELSAQVEDSGTKLLVTVDVPELYGTACEVLQKSSLETLVVGELAAMLPWLKGAAMKVFARSKIAKVDCGADTLRWGDWADTDSASFPQVTPGDLALLQYTGGTTGRPKGAMLSHSNLSINAQQVAALNPFDNPEDEIFMGALPMFHVFANTALLNHAVVSGGAIAIVPRFEAKQVLETIGKRGATGFPGVPTMFQALLDHPDLDATDLSTIKVCISGGAPLPAPVREKWEERTGARLVEGYGLTESSGVVSVNPYEGMRKPGTIGQVVPQTRVRLVDKEDPNKPAAAGEPGELVIAGPQVMQGYWNRPDTAATSFVEFEGERWLRTGDVAVIDEDGFIKIVDRIKDMIAVGGFKVFPSEVEKVILKHPAIKEVLVLGLPDDYAGESVNAYVTLNGEGDVSTDELRTWANERLGKHERVASLSIREELPKTMIGKLDRKALKAEVLDKA
ncbi:long-chain acyl-CoA synthetase [Altererythrobacter xiamenensis]|uniref:Long-chain acyl-CoA synthetase n=1 Tax=Altererythrobacter xiamenensis TaxID=1316679 RepID=A0A1Y6F6S5_9SPHN|nr:long-chain fatty acid--CoA ligase [Altererythrobacter xiamenensis]SMQ69040.1 long-chain acyl-CoA synthetase [Altererythrobacter xiamenensis]